MKASKLWIGWGVLAILAVVGLFIGNRELAYGCSTGAAILGFMAFAST